MLKYLFLTMLLLTVLQASKPSVPLKPQIERADYIIVATALNSCTYCKDQNSAKFKVIKIVKGEITERDFTVIAASLSFDIGTKYILFLRKEEKQFYWIKGNASRLVATEENLQNVEDILSTKK